MVSANEKLDSMYAGFDRECSILIYYECTISSLRAAFLGNATNVKLLVLDSSGLRKVTAGVNNGTGVDSELELIDKLGFRWTNPTLQRRVQFVEMMKS